MTVREQTTAHSQPRQPRRPRRPRFVDTAEDEADPPAEPGVQCGRLQAVTTPHPGTWPAERCTRRPAASHRHRTATRTATENSDRWTAPCSAKASRIPSASEPTRSPTEPGTATAETARRPSTNSSTRRTRSRIRSSPPTPSPRPHKPYRPRPPSKAESTPSTPRIRPGHSARPTQCPVGHDREDPPAPRRRHRDPTPRSDAKAGVPLFAASRLCKACPSAPAGFRPWADAERAVGPGQPQKAGEKVRDRTQPKPDAPRPGGAGSGHKGAHPRAVTERHLVEADDHPAVPAHSCPACAADVGCSNQIQSARHHDQAPVRPGGRKVPNRA
ncbi:hypothetical protein SAURM35S_03907 [Streptomyces aurantiogriseus]